MVKATATPSKTRKPRGRRTSSSSTACTAASGSPYASHTTTVKLQRRDDRLRRTLKVASASFANMDGKPKKLLKKDKLENSAFRPGQQFKGKGALNLRRSFWNVY